MTVVSLEKATSVPGTRVLLRGADRVLLGRTSEQGTVSFTGVLPGSYELHVEAEAFRPVEVAVDLAPGEQAQRTVELQSAVAVSSRVPWYLIWGLVAAAAVAVTLAGYLLRRGARQPRS